MRRDRYAENKGKINAQKRMAYARRKTGNMTTKEFAAYKRELAARKGLKQNHFAERRICRCNERDEYKLVS